jgi:hypothetical protein
MYGIHFKIIGNYIKRNIMPEMITKLRNLGNLRKNVRQVMKMPDGVEIDDIEEACVMKTHRPPEKDKGQVAKWGFQGEQGVSFMQ